MTRITVLRTIYSKDTTAGIMLLDDKWFGYTLEDRVRPKLSKIKARTAIPAGFYEVIVDNSTRFGRLMPRILNVPGFTGVRIHVGNTHKDTEGCILVAKHRIGRERIWKSLESTLTQKLLGKHPVTIEIINGQPGYYYDPEH